MTLKKILSAIHVAEDGLLVVVLLSMILLAVLQIVLRNFFDWGFSWIDPLLRSMLLWIALLGALAASRNNNHISIDLVSRFLSDSKKIVVKLLMSLFAAVMCGLVAYYSTLFVISEYQYSTPVFAGVPSWLIALVIPYAFALMALRYLLVASIALKASFNNVSAIK